MKTMAAYSVQEGGQPVGSGQTALLASHIRPPSSSPGRAESPKPARPGNHIGAETSTRAVVAPGVQGHGGPSPQADMGGFFCGNAGIPAHFQRNFTSDVGLGSRPVR